MWKPTASKKHIQLRAEVYRKIRQFFYDRGVMEVETPLLSHASVTNIYIDSFTSPCKQTKKTYYLQTSPEYAMKRLLCADSGPIFQISKAFRQGESGSQHNPEFSMLEWYRPGFTHHHLMDEVDQLLQLILNTEKADKITYCDLFLKFLEFNPLTISHDLLIEILKEKQLFLNLELAQFDKDDLLQLLMSHCIEPQLGKAVPLFVYDFPATQAALAKISKANPPVAERFEVYLQGKELANGFHELTDADEQLARFKKDMKKRGEKKLPTIPIDENLIAALRHGMPACAGVAMGMDRLLMVLAKTNDIKDILTFYWDNA